MESKKSRLLGLDALRLVAALLVICQHVTTYCGDAFIRPISRIAVFLFFLISGYFLYDERAEIIRGKCLKSIRKLCSIYLWAILIYGIEALYEAIKSGSFDVFYIGPWKLFVFFASCSSPFFPYGYHLWFLIALVESLLIIAILAYKCNPYTYKNIGVICFLCVLFGITITHKSVFLPFNMTLFIALPTIIMGGVIRKTGMQVKSWLAIGLIISCSLVSIYESYCWGDKYGYSTILLSVLVFLQFIKLSEGKAINMLAKYGAKYSLGIYIIHPLLIDFCMKIDDIEEWSIIMNPIFILVFSTILVMISINVPLKSGN